MYSKTNFLQMKNNIYVKCIPKTKSFKSKIIFMQNNVNKEFIVKIIFTLFTEMG